MRPVHSREGLGLVMPVVDTGDYLAQIMPHKSPAVDNQAYAQKRKGLWEGPSPLLTLLVSD